ncbi:uncharacterized protein LOC109541017 isoform X1 [Dendroctonus ponderosae]|uniref:uncharacterized protein LOC109541017 isoform X1 n=1 Tax=Dendroctonus ponderosae TaxID=77166 RepID=UPI0020358579|nr:uncharacterized protein LOC109541017 isoform X1 [Dendroctonus ponderosae]
MGNLLKVLSVFLLLGYSFAQIVEDIYDKNSTVITTRNVTAFTGKIIVKEVSKPHNLFIGRCTKKYPILHQENIVVNNDGQSILSSNIVINVDGPVSIACVNISDEDPEVSAYPSYVSGGIGHNYVEFNVQTTYGKGFKFYVQIFGNLTAKPYS